MNFFNIKCTDNNLKVSKKNPILKEMLNSNFNLQQLENYNYETLYFVFFDNDLDLNTIVVIFKKFYSLNLKTLNKKLFLSLIKLVETFYIEKYKEQNEYKFLFSGLKIGKKELIDDYQNYLICKKTNFLIKVDDLVDWGRLDLSDILKLEENFVKERLLEYICTTTPFSKLSEHWVTGKEFILIIKLFIKYNISDNYFVIDNDDLTEEKEAKFMEMYNHLLKTKNLNFSRENYKFA